MIKWLIFLLCLANQAEAQSFTVKELKIEGFNKTDPAVIEREIEFSVGDEITEEDIKLGIENLENTFIFYELSYEVSGEANERKVTIKGKDRWTTIPIFKVASGGGTTQLIAGLYDANVAGKFFELGAQYERLGKTDSGVFWYRDRWFTGRRLFLDFQLWRTNRIRTKYFQDPIDRTEKAGFLLTRSRAYLGLTREFNRNLNVGLYLEHNDDTFSENYVPDEVKILNEGLPDDTETNFLGLLARFGRIQFNDFLVDGTMLTLDYKHADVQTKGFSNFDTFEANFQYFKTLPLESTVGFRLMGGSTNTDILQYLFYLGGLDRIRGFADNRFAGKHYWLSNMEFRIPSYRTGSFVLQHVVFYDVIAAKDEFSDLGSATGASVGTGVRFIFPKIYRFVARLDFAKNTLRRDELPVSFGVQQFF